MKAAFDSVDRVALWKALKDGGVPYLVLQLVLHSQTGAKVRSGGSMRRPAYIRVCIGTRPILHSHKLDTEPNSKLVSQLEINASWTWPKQTTQ